jgi:hypothetical protein
MLRDSLPDDLQPFESELGHIVREALVLFETRYGHLRAGMRPVSERNNIHDCMEEVAKKYFPESCKRRGNLFLLCLGKNEIKLKKFDRRLLTSSYPTQAVLDFVRQSMRDLLDLFDDEPRVNLHLGYIPDEIALAKSSMWIVRPKGLKNNDWVYELKPEAAAALAPVLPKTNPDVPKQPGRVRPKRSKDPKTGEADKK